MAYLHQLKHQLIVRLIELLVIWRGEQKPIFREIDRARERERDSEKDSRFRSDSRFAGGR